MWSIVSGKSSNLAYGVKVYVADKEKDIGEIPIGSAKQGSICFCIENFNFYILDASKHWFVFSSVGSNVGEIDETNPDPNLAATVKALVEYVKKLLREDVVATIDVGGIKAHDELPKYMSFTDFVKKLVVQDVLPTAHVELSSNDKPVPHKWLKQSWGLYDYYYYVKFDNWKNITGTVSKVELYQDNKVLKTFNSDAIDNMNKDYPSLLLTDMYGGNNPKITIPNNNDKTSFYAKIYYKSDIDGQSKIIETEHYDVASVTHDSRYMPRIIIFSKFPEDSFIPGSYGAKQIPASLIEQEFQLSASYDEHGQLWFTGAVNCENKYVAVYCPYRHFNPIKTCLDMHGIDYINSFKYFPNVTYHNDTSVNGSLLCLPYALTLNYKQFRMHS